MQPVFCELRERVGLRDVFRRRWRNERRERFMEECCREGGIQRGLLLSAHQLCVECSQEHALVHQASAREALHRATVRHHAALGQVTERRSGAVKN